MFKRIALFILAHVAFFGVAAAIVAASTTGADAQMSDNPYDMRFVTTEAQSLRAAPEMDSAVTGSVETGVRNVAMRWCRPEFDFQGWMFASPRAQQRQLDERVCEVSVNGQIGFIPGSALRVQ
jgi:hypothetical protein